MQYLLKNDRYVGHITWNKRKWFRDPMTKRRRFKERPPSEWVVMDRPDLRIVDPVIWERVQQTFRVWSGSKKPGRPPGSSSIVKYEHLLTGLLRCGVCGGSMTVLGSKRKRLPKPPTPPITAGVAVVAAARAIRSTARRASSTSTPAAR